MSNGIYECELAHSYSIARYGDESSASTLPRLTALHLVEREQVTALSALFGVRSLLCPLHGTHTHSDVTLSVIVAHCCASAAAYRHTAFDQCALPFSRNSVPHREERSQSHHRSSAVQYRAPHPLPFIRGTGQDSSPGLGTELGPSFSLTEGANCRLYLTCLAFLTQSLLFQIIMLRKSCAMFIYIINIKIDNRTGHERFTGTLSSLLYSSKNPIT
jgi:hypothetical protein